MNKNVGRIDAVIRIILSLIFFSLFFILEGNLRFLAVVGIIPLVTGLIGTCPLYMILGIKTCPLKTK